MRFSLTNDDGSEGLWELTDEEFSPGVPLARFVQSIPSLADVADDLLAQNLDIELARLT
jgi:hypothetical protein